MDEQTVSRLLDLMERLRAVLNELEAELLDTDEDDEPSKVIW